MPKSSNTPTNTDLQISIADVKKDLEYLIILQNKQQTDMVNIRGEVEILKQFFYKWKGAALVLVGLGGVLTWLIDTVLKALPLIGK